MKRDRRVRRSRAPREGSRADAGVTIELPRFLEASLALGHPWVYRDHVPPGFSAPSGTFVRVKAGHYTAYALWDESSALALRIFSRGGVPDGAWFDDRVSAALALREPVRRSDTTAYRWIAGEGDGMPAVVVDRYDGWAVVATYADAAQQLVPHVVGALERADALSGVLVRRAGEPAALAAGREPPDPLVVREHGLSFRVSLRRGQKTGMFLDQRENRRFVEHLAAGKRVANVFAYTGGFSVYAARGGAASVTSVDSAADAVAEVLPNVRLNGLDESRHEAIVADAFEWLTAARQGGRKFHVVVCDPPSFARSRDQLDAALDSYVRVNTLALGVVAPGGWLVTASCTAQVAPPAFREALAEAARRARCVVRIGYDTGHAIDHPIAVGHPEGRYLKCLAGRVEPLV